jgi:hypothetical protein
VCVESATGGLMAFLLDDDWDNDPRVVRAGTAAFGLYSRCGMWVARHLTDGFVPAEVATTYGTREWVAKLVDVGLWTTAVDGYQMADYLTLNPSAKKVRKRREQYAERQRRWREAKTRDKRGSNASRNASPSPPLKGKDALRSVPPWCRHCHPDTRMFVTDDDSSIRCPNCHPNRGAA